MSLNKANLMRDALAYRLYAATKPHDATPPITYTNATVKEAYVRSVMASPRADADNHLSITSRGLSVQIERV